MIVPEEILEKQRCFICFKYLSVGPIKVYPDRQVKCGRCSGENDEGTESKLYKTIVKCIQFPCVNRFNGCKEVLGIAEMKYHENTCEEEYNKCPMCPDFNGSGYNLNLHLQHYHQKDTLHATEFLIDLQKGSQEDMYFYKKNALLLFITFRYDAITHRMHLNVAFKGTHYQGNVMQMFTLHNSDKKQVYKTDILPCSNVGQEKTEFEIDLSSLKFTRDIVVCKFHVKEEPILNLQEFSQVIDSMDDCAIIRCKFDNISTYADDTHHYHPNKFVVNGITFEVCINIGKNGTNIDLDQSRMKVEKNCTVFAKFTLISTRSKEHFVTNRGQIELRGNKNAGTNMYLRGELTITKTDLLNSDNGFIENDSIIVEIRCQVQVSNTKLLCVYCDSCKNCTPIDVTK